MSAWGDVVPRGISSQQIWKYLLLMSGYREGSGICIHRSLRSNSSVKPSWGSVFRPNSLVAKREIWRVLSEPLQPAQITPWLKLLREKACSTSQRLMECVTSKASFFQTTSFKTRKYSVCKGRPNQKQQGFAQQRRGTQPRISLAAISLCCLCNLTCVPVPQKWSLGVTLTISFYSTGYCRVV